jgi:Na+-driven multidrug efflux pump
MDLLTGNLKRIFLKYLVASVGSAMVISIYSFVDTVAVGQYEGADGIAAMAVINPIWGIITFLGVLCGVGGAVLMSNARGRNDRRAADNFYSCSLILMLAITLALWLFSAVYMRDLLSFSGAGEHVSTLALSYTKWIVAFFPIFTMSIFLAVFIRNDNAPNLAMKAVIIGGVFNIFGDWFFVFPLNMGTAGAAIATVLGTAIQLGVLCSHFFSKRCGLKFKRPANFSATSSVILVSGASSGFIDLANAALVLLINATILKYSGTTELAVYGVICTCASLFQVMFAGIGHAAQPILSINYGAKKNDRIDKTLLMAVTAAGIFGLVLTLLGCLFPNALVMLFMDAAPEVFEIAPRAIGVYFTSFLLASVNVVATFYFQSVMRTAFSLSLALSRGIVVSGLLVVVLPSIFSHAGIWWAIPAAELLTALLACVFYFKTRKHR